MFRRNCLFDDVRSVAFDANVIRCIDDFVCWCLLSDDKIGEMLICQRRCIRSRYDQMHWRFCLWFCQNWLHSMLMLSGALAGFFFEWRGHDKTSYLMILLTMLQRKNFFSFDRFRIKIRIKQWIWYCYRKAKMYKFVFSNKFVVIVFKKRAKFK